MAKKKVVEISEVTSEFVHVKTCHGVIETKEDGSTLTYAAGAFYIMPLAVAKEWIAANTAVLCDEKNEIIPVPEPEEENSPEVIDAKN